MKISAIQIDPMIKTIIRMFQPWKWFSFSKRLVDTIYPKKLSQFALVKNQIDEVGHITTVYALENNLHRLKKEIYRLRQAGYIIKTQYYYYQNKRQTRYTLIQTPLMKHPLGI